ncbi:MAG: FAD-binding oxidoreductase [Synechococcaceae cyanobacterium SM2_3_1]|nr:FAD-binding oxidoreductase [Synechococcaceae cyanobacterium SM2_3_1]
MILASDPRLTELQQQIGPEAFCSVVEGEADWSPSLQGAVSTPIPSVVIAPATVSELAEVQQWCARHQLPVLIAGRGSKLHWGDPVQGPEVILSTQRMANLIDHAAADLTVTVAAGMPLQELQTQLAHQGQFWPVNPLYLSNATVGGILATADAGSWRHRYGSVRDLLLGITLVRADGAVAKAGGRVVKNVAGYDLMKLMTGSWGSLGILAEVTLRLYPLPEARQSWVLVGDPQAVEALRSRLLASALMPAGLDLLSPSLLAPWEGRAGEVGLVVSFHGLQESLEEQGQRLLQWAQDLSLRSQDLQEGEGLDQHLQKTFQDQVSRPGLAKLGVLPSQAVALLNRLVQEDPDGWVQIHAGCGIGRWRWHPNTWTAAALTTLQRQLQAQQGYFKLLEAPLDLKQQLLWQPPDPVQHSLWQRLKSQFDPQHLLNPGRL